MQPPPLPTPTSQLTEKEGWVGVEVGNGEFPTTCNVESNLNEEDWELGLIWFQSRRGSSRGLAGQRPPRPRVFSYSYLGAKETGRGGP